MAIGFIPERQVQISQDSYHRESYFSNSSTDAIHIFGAFAVSNVRFYYFSKCIDIKQAWTSGK